MQRPIRDRGFRDLRINELAAARPGSQGMEPFPHSYVALKRVSVSESTYFYAEAAGSSLYT